MFSLFHLIVKNILKTNLLKIVDRSIKKEEKEKKKTKQRTHTQPLACSFTFHLNFTCHIETKTIIIPFTIDSNDVSSLDMTFHSHKQKPISMHVQLQTYKIQ